MLGSNLEYQKKKAIVLHDGCNFKNSGKTISKNEIKKKLNIPHNNKIILYAGSLYKNRCINNILKLAKSFNSETFVIVGGPQKNKEYYDKLSKKLNIYNIIFTGPVFHHVVKQYLHISDVLLMIWSDQVKTINYCSPLKMFEYMAAGRIIVGHAFPTITEVLKHGETAFLSNPKSFSDLKNNLSKAIKVGYPNEMSNRAKQLAQEHYTWYHRANKILNSIKENTAVPNNQKNETAL